uniref:Uncharacterized protein n=1 Tax=Timspurckia oligopyrenoides TaxID=708627 RepID=A0A7S0ZKP3_9RHOD
MSIEQLEALCEKDSRLRQDPACVEHLLAKGLPSIDTQLSMELQIGSDVALEYLNHTLNVLRPLPTRFNSMKCAALHHKLSVLRKRGVSPLEPDFKESLMNLIEIPIQSPFSAPSFIEKWSKTDRNCIIHAHCQVQPLPVVSHSALTQALQRYIRLVILKSGNSKQFEQYVEAETLEQWFAEEQLMAGQVQQASSRVLPPDRVKALNDRVVLEFSDENPVEFAVGSQVQLKVIVKNVEHLVMRLYEVNTESAYTNQTVHSLESLSVEGLVANNEIDFKYSQNAIIQHEETLSLSSVGTNRGAYIIELAGNGRIVRCLIQIGHLSTVSSVGLHGQNIRVLNEMSEECKSSEIIIRGQRYQSDSSGCITIPFSEGNTEERAIILSDGFASMSTIRLIPEDYSLECGFFTERETLLSKRRCKVVVRCRLLLCGTIAPLSLLQDTRLSIMIQDLDGVETRTEISNIGFSSDRDSLHDFFLPDKAVKVEFSLSTSVRSERTGKDIQLFGSDSVQFNEIDRTNLMEDLYLQQSEEGYTILSLCKSGRPRANKTYNVRLHFNGVKYFSDYQLATNLSGKINLGKLAGVASVEISNRLWTLPVETNNRPKSIVCEEGELISFCSNSTLEKYKNDRYKVGLLSVSVKDEILHDVSHFIQFSSGKIQLSSLKQGNYVLYMRDACLHLESVVVKVTKNKLRIVDGDYGLSILVNGRFAFHETCAKLTASIKSASFTKDEVVVVVENASPQTRCHVVLTHFVPIHSVTQYLLDEFSDHTERKSPDVFVPTLSTYMRSQGLSAEQQYIRNRSQEAKIPGVMLTRPSLLIVQNDNPGKVFSPIEDDTPVLGGVNRMEMYCEDEMAKDDLPMRSRAAFGGRGPGGLMSAAPKMMKRRAQVREAECLAEEVLDESRVNDIISGSSRHNLEFLSNGASTFYNLTPDNSGAIVVKLNAQHATEHFFCTIALIDRDVSMVRHVVRREEKVEYSDTSLQSSFDVDRHWAEQKNIEPLNSSETLEIFDRKSCEYAVYGSLGKVFDVLSALMESEEKEKLQKFRFIIRWNALSEEEKLKYFSEFASHELNFFLAMKDPSFFESIVKPFLQNKFSKSFLDQWLLKEDVKEYCQISESTKLNTFERIILAQLLRVDSIFEMVKNQADLLPSARDDFDILHKFALRNQPGDSLDGDEEQRKERKSSDDDSDNSMGSSEMEEEEEGGDDGMPAAPPASRSMVASFARSSPSKPFYKPLENVSEYGEMHYYKRKIEEQDENLIRVSHFWADFAEHCRNIKSDTMTSFLSQNFLRAHRNWTEAVLALAVLDLPFDDQSLTVTNDPSSLKTQLSASSNTLLVHQQVLPVEVELNSALFASQNYFDPDDRYRIENKERVEKFLTTDFETFKVYGCRSTVTNVSALTQKIDILEQIPQGSVPLSGGFFVKSHYVELKGYSTVTDEFYFYFPESGTFSHFPVHVAQRGTCVAHAVPTKLVVVVERLSRDVESWPDLVQYGSTNDIVRFLQTHNPLRYPLKDLEPHITDKNAFEAIIKVLLDQGCFVSFLWKYGVLHGDRNSIAIWSLKNPSFVQMLRGVSESKILKLDVEHEKFYQHLEYEPLVNARAHVIRESSPEHMAQLTEQFRLLCSILHVRSSLQFHELLSVCYYLISHDRFEEAQVFFSKLETEAQSEALSKKYSLQMDYMRCYFEMLLGKTYVVARDIATRYKDYKVKRWRNLFREVLSQLDEIEGVESTHVIDPAEETRNQELERLAASEPSLTFKIEANAGLVYYQNVSTLSINYYPMDVEELFSMKPFGEASSDIVIRPKHSTTHALDEPVQGVFRFDLDPAFKNALIEVEGGGKRNVATHLSRDFIPHIYHQYGLLRVSKHDQKSPLVAAYVKVYAETSVGPTFWKDGYTDLRGKFDYATVSGRSAFDAKRFAILIVTESHGIAWLKANSIRSSA